MKQLRHAVQEGIFRCKLFAFGFLLLITTNLFAQSGKIVTGVVLDQDGKPLEGVLVKVPQTNTQTRTKKDGTFLLDLPASANTIGFSMKGMQYQQVNVSNQTSVSIRMRPMTSVDENDEANAGARQNQPRGDRAITGTVINDNGTSISGATVKVKGTNTSVAADENGQFIITPPPGRVVLQVSAVGHQDKEVTVANRQSAVEIILPSTANDLDAVVVVGYNTQKKVNLTGSVATVDFKELKNTPQSNTLAILSGRLAGVSLIQAGGQPGDNSTEVLVRGIGTLNDAQPLVIIDGVQSTLNDLSNLSPNEISNVSVLKDASSAAIYGARGANGVILVTTVDPGKRKLQLNVNAWHGWQTATYVPKFVEPWQWMVLHNEAAGNIWPESIIEDLKNGRVNDTFNYNNWPNEVFITAPMSNINVGVNGGTQNLSYQASLGYLTQDGIIRNTSSERYNFRTNVRARLSEKVESGINIWGYLQNAKEPFAGTGAIINSMNQEYPFVPTRWSNGNYAVDFRSQSVGSNLARTIQNPVLRSEIGSNLGETFKGNLQTYLQYQPIKGLRLRTSFTYSYANLYRERFNPTFSYPNLAGEPGWVNNQNQLNNLDDQDKQLQIQTTAIYNKVFADKHAFTFLAGHEFVDFKSRNFSATGFNLPSNDLSVLNATVSDFQVGGNKAEWSLQSFFGRLNYAFDNKYLFEANFRADGSSRFSADNKYGYFPSFSAGWIISRENFFESLTKTISLLKIRAGWGKVGNDRIGNYTFEQFINLSNYYPSGAGSLQSAGAITEYGNPIIRWESTTTTNLGLDIGLFNNKVVFNADVYRRLTEDILFAPPLPPSFGQVGPATQNIGKVSNNGWELNLEYRNRAGRFLTYNFGLNVSYVKNTLEELNTQEVLYGNPGNPRFILREGEAINSFYGLIWDGVYRDTSEFSKYPIWNNNNNARRLGAMYYRDINKDGKVDDKDRQVIGTANTPYTFGLTGSVAYKGFDLSFLFQGVQGKSIYLIDFGNRPGNAGNTNFWKEWWDNRYDAVSNPDGTWPVLKRQSPEVNPTSTFWMNDASYVRLKNVEIGYGLPSSVLNKIKFRQLRLYVSGQNLFTFSNLIKQIDPERNSLQITNNSFPQVRVVTVGINAGF